MNVATKYKGKKTKVKSAPEKDYYCIKGEWHELTKEQFAKKFIEAHPLKARMIVYLSKLFALVVKTAILFLFVTAIYASFKWAIGVWM